MADGGWAVADVYIMRAKHGRRPAERCKRRILGMINIPVLPLRELEFLYYFYIEIYIEIKIFSTINSFDSYSIDPLHLFTNITLL